MKRDGRTLGHETLEEMRVLAVQRMNEGERPADVAASFGLHRSWAFKCRAAAKGRGKGLRALRSTKATGRPRKLGPTQERQVFRWVNGKNPQQYGFDFGLWTPRSVQLLGLDRFHSSPTLTGAGAELEVADGEGEAAVSQFVEEPLGYRAIRGVGPEEGGEDGQPPGGVVGVGVFADALEFESAEGVAGLGLQPNKHDCTPMGRAGPAGRRGAAAEP